MNIHVPHVHGTHVIKRILRVPDVGTTVCDQCAYGLLTHDEAGNGKPAVKPTIFMSNSPVMLG